MTYEKAVVPPWAYGAAALALILLAAVVVLAMRRRQTVQVLPAGLQLPSSVEQIEATLSGAPPLPAGKPEEPSPLLLREKAMEMLHSHPERAVHILHAWLNEPQTESRPQGSDKPQERRSLEPHRS
jgi:flagellar biosynthesis/type III secretory pathway M-ring protein FliF/YscJ